MVVPKHKRFKTESMDHHHHHLGGIYVYGGGDKARCVWEQKETESGLPLVFFGDFDDVFACFVSARIC